MTEHSFHFLDAVIVRVPLYAEADYTLENLSAAINDRRFLNALWLASPEFFNELEKLSFQFEKLDSRKQFALTKYFNRSCFRPTPFGAFSSFSCLTWVNHGSVNFNGKQILHLLPSREYQLTFRNQIEHKNVQLNPTIYRLGDQYRFVASNLDIRKGGDIFELKSFSAEPLNRKLMSFLKHKTLTTIDVHEFIKEKTGGSDLETANYVDFLVREEVLLTASSHELIERATSDELLNMIPHREKWKAIRHVNFDDSLFLPSVAETLETDSRVKNNSHKFYSGSERIPTLGYADENDKVRIEQAYHALRQLSTPSTAPELRNFIKEFKARYDRQKVPLMVALDADDGIPYGDFMKDIDVSPLLDNVEFAEIQPERIAQKWTELHALLLSSWLRHARINAFGPVVLTDDDLTKLNQPLLKHQIPPSYSVMYRKLGNKLWIESMGGATATSLLGRFSLFSDAIHDCCRKIASEEQQQNPDVILAEISQLSETHADNINRRRAIYDYVIPINAYCTAAQDKQLPLYDLLVSVYGEELILESASLNKRVIPRLPTAYNYNRNSLPVFRFLCDLQRQDSLSDLSIDLERFFPELTFYPRIEYKEVILCLAKWKFKRHDFDDLLKSPSPLVQLRLFCEKNGIPRFVSTGEGDQQLVYDLTNDWEAEFFLNYLKSVDKVRILEYLPSSNSIANDTKVHTGQYIATVINTNATYDGSKEPTLRHRITRDFPAGSEWLYIKIYCRPKSADHLLTEHIYPFIRQHRKDIQSWFFIRYSDTGNHLRLRLRGEPAKLAVLFGKLGKRFQRNNAAPFIREYQSDTYRRELERYDPTQIELIERCFSDGSEWVGKMLSKEFSDEDWEFRAIMLVWLTIRHFLEDWHQQQSFIQIMAENFAKMHKYEKKHRVSLDKKYRLLITALISHLLPSQLEAFKMDATTSQWLNRIGELSSATASWDEQKRIALLADTIHMQVNRMFRASQRRYEAVIYYYLNKYCLRVHNMDKTEN